MIMTDGDRRYAQEEKSSQSSASHQEGKSSQSSAYHQVYSEEENNLNHFLYEVSIQSLNFKEDTILNEAEDVYKQIILLKRNINNPIFKSFDDMEQNYSSIKQYISYNKLSGYDEKVIFNTYLNDYLIKYYEDKSHKGYTLLELKKRKEILNSEFNKITQEQPSVTPRAQPPAGQKPPAKPRAQPSVTPRAQPPAKSREQTPTTQKPPQASQVTQPPAGSTKYIDKQGNKIEKNKLVKWTRNNSKIPNGAIGEVIELKKKNKNGKTVPRVKVDFFRGVGPWTVSPKDLILV